MIEQTVKEITAEALRLHQEGELTQEALHVAVSANQQLIAFYDALLDGGLVVRDPAGANIDAIADLVVERIFRYGN